MKILHTSDWHLDARTAGIVRFEEVRRAVRQTVEAAKREKVDLYAFTGDLADPDCGTGILRCVEVLVEVASELAGEGIDVVVLSGNHDVVEDGTGLTTLSPLRGLRLTGDHVAQVFVEEAPKLLTFEPSPGVWVVCMPYPAATNAYDPVAFLEKAKAQMANTNGPPGRVVVLTHLQIEGARLGEESTDMARGRDVRFPIEECELDWAILAGHYHQSQVIRREGCQPIRVVGSVARLAFGEESNRPCYQIVTV